MNTANIIIENDFDLLVQIKWDSTANQHQYLRLFNMRL